MQFISGNAGRGLLEKAGSIYPEHQGWQCVYLCFSGHKEQYDDTACTRITADIVRDMIAVKEGHIYRCADNDVIILCKGEMPPLTQDVFIESGEPAGSLTEMKRNLCTRIDLSRQWPLFLSLCEDKAVEDSDEPYSVVLAQQDKRCERLLVLLAEEESYVCNVIRAALGEGYDIIDVADEHSTLSAYTMLHPDVVFLDIDLPGAGGNAVLHKLLAVDKAAFIVMLANASMKETIVSALEKGAQGFITRPFTREKLSQYMQLLTVSKRPGKNGTT